LPRPSARMDRSILSSSQKSSAPYKEAQTPDKGGRIPCLINTTFRWVLERRCASNRFSGLVSPRRARPTQRFSFSASASIAPLRFLGAFRWLLFPCDLVVACRAASIRELPADSHGGFTISLPFLYRF